MSPGADLAPLQWSDDADLLFDQQRLSHAEPTPRLNVPQIARLPLESQAC